jgi:glyoxylase-like metal-dependent hydrolase (beta-lactamase superfamily II)
MLSGGTMGGFFFPFYPTNHYFQDDRERNQSNIEKLVRAGARMFYPGHGGPLLREDVIKSFNIPM